MHPRVPAQTPAEAAVEARPAAPSEDWQAIGEAFETMGKIGLAMTVGFTAAALFCRWAELRKLKASSVQQVLEQLS
ncbi:MAG: hypothetical protein KIS61_25615 [Candidatus Eremiobacteraeota bacterium]|nr:hypothetical protein [Candidatus Eremiobacteraeota bacterium]